MAGLINVDLGSILGNLGNIGKLFKDIRAAITGKEIADPTKLAEIEAKLTEIEAQLTQGQLLINQIEAQHASVFVAGWRPACGWCCAFALAYHYIINPLMTWVSAVVGHPIVLPMLDVSDLMVLLLGMLGIGGMRSYEKIKGVQNEH